MMDTSRNDDDDNDRTELYTPPPMDSIDSENSGSEKENNCVDANPIKQQSIIVLDDSNDQIPATAYTYHEPIDNYWDQWPLVDNPCNDETPPVNLYSIPDIDILPSPPRETILPENKPIPATISNDIIGILNGPLPLTTPSLTSNCRRKPSPKRKKKKKKPMSEYRPPSPFSPKPDYKTMDGEQLKIHAMRYGLSTTQAKSRLIKILDEIYNFTHQYETDTDYEFDRDDTGTSKDSSKEKGLSHTPPTPAAVSYAKRTKQRKAVHEMSSSDEADEQPRSLPPTRPMPMAAIDNEHDRESDDNDTDHEGRFLELTVYDLSSSSTTSSSSPSIITTPSTAAPNGNHSNDSSKALANSCSPSKPTMKSKTKTKPSAPALTSDSDTTSTKNPAKKTKLQTPTIPLKEIVRNYIASNDVLHARMLSYEPIDFEEFHKQIKLDLNLRIASKDLMHCLDDQCITFTLRSRKGAFSRVMKAKRRQK